MNGKWVSLIQLITIAVLLIGFPGGALGGSPPGFIADKEPALTGEIMINGEIIDAPLPYIYKGFEGVVMIPLRVVAEKLGMEVEWIPEEKSVIIDGVLQLWIDQPYYRQGQTAAIEFGPAPELSKGSTYVPLTFFSNAIKGYRVYVSDGRVMIANVDTIVFPASDNGKTEYNARIYEVEPFTLTIQLPEKWSYNERAPGAEADNRIALDAVFSILDILNENGKHVGAVGYNSYEDYEGAEDDPRAIYAQIALGNDYHFDVRDSYTIVCETTSGATATADVYYSATMNGSKEKNNKGIVSYNRDFHVYIAMEFDCDLVTDEQVHDIAASILLGSIVKKDIPVN